MATKRRDTGEAQGGVSLLETLKTINPVLNGPHSWFDKLTPEHQVEMLTIRAAYHRGEIKAVVRQIHEVVAGPLGIKVSAPTFGHWLKRKEG